MEDLSIQEKLKKEIMEQISDRATHIDNIKANMDESDVITLYHGTDSTKLNSILYEGIKPRGLTNNNNWMKDERAYSNENLVYLTNKWHYKYAFNSLESLLKAKYGDNWSDKKEGQWWNRLNPVPIYITCEVPKALLITDEDIVYSKYVKDEIKKAIKSKNNLALKLNWEDSLRALGTVGFLGTIEPKYIKSFTVMTDAKFYLELNNEYGQYMKDWHKWAKGKGKGKLRDYDLKKIENKYRGVATIPKEQVLDGYLVSQIMKDEKGNAGFVLNTPWELEEQPVNLERY